MTKPSLFRSHEHLSSIQPEDPVGRDAERRRIWEALRPLSGHGTPETLWISGPAGIGKTTCVRHVLDRLKNETRAKTAYINCWQYNTRPSLLTELLIQVGYPAPRKGKPVDELLSKLRELLDKSRGFAVVLDEFDQLRDGTEIIYDLQLLAEEAEHGIGVILVSNQHPREIQLDPRSRSRMQYRWLEFNPYTAAELRDILKERAERAFRPHAVSDEIVERIAERVAKEGGDCRRALELLLRAGRRADKERADEVVPAHITESRTRNT